MPTVRFEHLDVDIPCKPGDSIYDLAAAAGSPLSSACGAKASCGLCRIKVLQGTELLNSPNEAEERHLGNVYHINKVRLGCQTKIVDGNGLIEIRHVGRKKKKRR